MLTLEDRSVIAHRAATLDERLARSRWSPPADRAVGTVTPFECAALKTWQRAFSGTDRDAFLRRLSWDGLDAWSLAAALTASEPGRHTPPAWTTWLQRFGQYASALARELTACAIPPEVAWLVSGSSKSGTPSRTQDGVRLREPAFVELWVPVVRAIYAELRYAGRTLVSTLPSPVRHGFQRAWLADIAAAGQHAAWDAFQRYVVPAEDLARERPPWPANRAPSDRYDAFVAWQLREGLAPLFRDYPVLARDLALIGESAVAAALEMLRRVELDREVIGSRFPQGRDIGTLTNLRGRLSDPHGGQRRVTALTFSSGLRLVYKPRDVTLDSGFSELVEWLGANGLADPPLPARVLPRDRYGWAELIERGECSSEPEVHRAFDAAGVLLCLAWAMGARDLHWQNVIATSSGPVLIDLETLLQPDGLGEETSSVPPTSSVPSAAGEACLTSGLLSCLQPSADGDAVDVGGLCGRADRLPPVDIAEWQNLRTDAIEKHTVYRAIAPGLNQITLQGRVAEPASYADSLLGGYRRAYRCLLKHRDELVGPDGHLRRWFGGGLARTVLRPTQRYGQALAALREPAFLRDGVARCVALETLSRPFSSSRERPRAWPLATEERRALAALDVPRFSVRVDERCVREAREAGDLFTTSGLAAADLRLSSMFDEQLVSHEAAIAGSLGASPAARYRTEPELSVVARSTDEQSPDWHGGALWIAEEVLRASADATNNMAAGRSLSDVIRALGLYEGRLGVALFLAALQREHPDGRYEAVVRSALHAAAACLGRIESSRDRDGIDVGATSGLGSMALSATFIAQLHPDAGARRVAEQAAGLLDRRCLRACAASDLVAGTAGAVLALLAVHEHTGAAKWIDRAVIGGEVLLERARLRGAGRYWPSPQSRVRLGFAHGNSGIAYALLRLASVTFDKRFEEAALAALEYERAFYSPAQRSWPALVDDESDREAAGLTVWMNAWCYGAAGMALTRARAWRMTEDPLLEAETANAVEATAATASSMAEHLCCGNLGRADVMLTAARWLGDAHLAKRSRQLAADVLRRCLRRGHVALSSSGFTYVVSRPGFFQGLSGVGYHFLRQASPDALPSVLAFEPLPHHQAKHSRSHHVQTVD